MNNGACKRRKRRRRRRGKGRGRGRERAVTGVGNDGGQW
jgi:hypothetical protein